MAELLLPVAPVLPTDRTAVVRQSEVLAALSVALDLTEGQPPGHTVRSCAIALRLATELGLPEADQSALYYAVLLKDTGCSSNAARMAALFGAADQSVKGRMKFVDWHRKLPLAIQTLRNAGQGSGLRQKLTHFFGIPKAGEVTRSLNKIRCERGADIARELGFPEATALAIRNLDEHWDGGGYPEGCVGAEIPLLARIANLAQTVEIFHQAHGLEPAMRVVRQRLGSWFDPELANRVLGWRKDSGWWSALREPDIARAVVAAEPGGGAQSVDEAGLDRIAESFAGIIDAKSPFTFQHSANVARYARFAAEKLGLGPQEGRRLYRAGLLHDIGKLGVSNRVLDKPGPLNNDERGLMAQHPVYTWQILSRVTAFDDLAFTAALHHEKLDGSGYPWGFDADRLDRPARILAAADGYEALTADRPYRAGLSPEVTLGILQRDVRSGRLDAEAVAVLADLS